MTRARAERTGMSGTGLARARPRGLAAAAGLAVVLALSGCDTAEERAAEHLENALALIEEGDTVKAVLELRNTLKLNPDSARAHLELGKIREEQNRLGAALGHYRSVTELDPSLYQGHLRLGQIMLAAGDLDKALKSSNAAHQLAPENVEVLALRAATAFRHGDLAVARKSLDAAFAIDDSYPQLYLLRAALVRGESQAEKEAAGGEEDADPGEEALLAATDPESGERSAVPDIASEDLEDMLAAVEDGLTRAPDDLGLALARISVLARLGRVEEARAALAETVERHPENIGLRENLVREQLRNGDLEAAERNLRALADREPERSERVLDVVRLLMRRDGTDAGLAELDRRIAAAPDAVAAWPFIQTKASILLGEGRRDEAERVLREEIDALEGDPAVNEAKVALARLRLGMNDRAAGEDLIAAVLAEDEANAGALSLKAQLAIADQDYDTAIADLRKAVTEDPDNVGVLQLLAVAHRRNGNRQLAGERLADAMEASDNATGPVLDYARYLIREGKSDFAGQIIEDALGVRPNDRELLEALASLKLRQQDWIAAEELSQRIADLGAGDRLAADVLAAARAGQRDFEGSLAAMTGSGTDGARERDLEQLVIAHARAGQGEKARALVESRLEENPDDPDALRLMGTLRLVEGKTDDARRLLEKAVAVAPDNRKGYLALARLRGAQGDTDGARETLVEGVERTGSTGLRMALATVEERTGNVDAAIAQYRAVLRPSPASTLRRTTSPACSPTATPRPGSSRRPSARPSACAARICRSSRTPMAGSCICAGTARRPCR